MTFTRRVVIPSPACGQAFPRRLCRSLDFQLLGSWFFHPKCFGPRYYGIAFMRSADLMRGMLS